MLAMKKSSPHPFAALEPALILDAVETTGLRCDGRLSALNSYENRVYQVGIEDADPVIVKFYRPNRWSDAQIAEEHGFTVELTEAELPVVAPQKLKGKTLHSHAQFRFGVWPKRGGRAPEFDREETLLWMGRFVARIHAVGARGTFKHRERIEVKRMGIESVRWLTQQRWIPVDLSEAYASVAQQVLEAIDACFERAGNVRMLRIHGDCHAGNVLWTDAGPHFVDFDDCVTGPAIQDLWMLLSGDRESQTQQLKVILEGYEMFRPFDPAELCLVEALRALRLMHYAAWLARRWDDPAFPSAFPWFNTQRYWQDQILALREQIALMGEPPLPIT